MIYFDAAATTFQKPLAVAQAMQRALDSMTTPSRGGYREAALAAETVFACRNEAAEIFRVDTPEQIVFTMNATHALNIAIKTLVHSGDTVVASGYEHNAVMRPLYAIPNVQIKIADAPLFDVQGMLHKFSELVTPQVSAVVCAHVSNVFGFVLPIEGIAELCRERNVPLIIDASQSAGVLPLDFAKLGAAFAAMPGHKGLYGPQGTGLLICKDTAAPLLRGGTGSLSKSHFMPEQLPDRLEAGTQNICGIAGLLEGLRFVRKTGVQTIYDYEHQIAAYAASELGNLKELELYVSGQPACQSGVLSFRMKGLDCEEAAEKLAKRGIAVRAGLHCAPLAHETAGTVDSGTIRASFSVFNTEEEVDIFVRELKEILSKKECGNSDLFP